MTSGSWVNNFLYAGNSGAGTLFVNGGYVSGTNVTLGYIAGSSGTATVSSGTLAVFSQLDVGYNGRGNLLVNGGLVTGSNTYIGHNATTSSGTVTVSSGTWVNSGSLVVGNSGTGTLAINGGYVSNTYASIGNGVGSNGSAAVSSGTWNNTADIYVGKSSAGALTVNGGYVSVSGDSYIGSGTLGTGSVTVTKRFVSQQRHVECGKLRHGWLAVIGEWRLRIRCICEHRQCWRWLERDGDREQQLVDFRRRSPLWANRGAGKLVVDGGVVSSSSTIYVGNNAGSTGSVIINSGSLAGGSDIVVEIRDRFPSRQWRICLEYFFLYRWQRGWIGHRNRFRAAPGAIWWISMWVKAVQDRCS